MISAILLAAGQSKRMNGENKLIKRFKNKSLINHSLSSLIKSKVNKIIIVLGYQNSEIAQEKTAQVIFGALPAIGKLPVSLGENFPVGTKFTTQNLHRLAYGMPESVGINSAKLHKIDSLAQLAVDEEMTPGVQMLVARRGKVIYQKNFGYGDALIYGIKNCQTQYFCIFNADGSFKPSEIDDMMQKLEKDELDFVFGSRYQKNSGSDDDTIVTLIGNYIFTLIGKIFFKLNISDILYTFVLGETRSANNLNLTQKDFSLCVEIPIKAVRNNMKISSISSYERERIAGKKKVNAFKDGFLILMYMIKLFFKK